MVGRDAYTLPLPDWLTRKFDALERQLDLRVVASADPGSPPPTTASACSSRAGSRLLDGVLFYLRLPFHVRRQIIEFRPEAIIAREPLHGARRARSAVRWRAGSRRSWSRCTATGGLRPACTDRRRARPSPLADAVGRIALRRGDAVRALSSYTEGLVEEVRGIPVTASFEAYMDLSTFTAHAAVRRSRTRPTALFVGMLEAYKNIDGLVAAWRRGRASCRRRARDRRQGHRRGARRRAGRRASGQRRAHRAAAPEASPSRWTRATVLVLPSRSEGLGRVLDRGDGARARDRREPRRRDPGRRRGTIEEALLVDAGRCRRAGVGARAVALRPPLAERLGGARSRATGVAHDAGRVRGASPVARGRDAARRRRACRASGRGC